MKMWHVSAPGEQFDGADPEQSDGYVVHADTEEEAVRLVEERCERGFLEYMAEYGRGESIIDERRLWYYGGKWPKDWVVREIGPVYSIPFLGYSW